MVEDNAEDFSNANFKSRTPFSAPFGRAGFHRLVNDRPSGPYSHTPYNHPIPQYFHPYVQNPWWKIWRPLSWWQQKCGYSFNYESDHAHWTSKGARVYSVCMVSLLIFTVLFASIRYLSVWGYANYKDRQLLYYNKYWCGYEYVSAGSQITFSMESTSGVTFFIWNQNITELPTSNMSGSIEYEIILEGNQYNSTQLYLKKGSTISYNFTSNDVVDFLFTDAENFNYWYMGYDYDYIAYNASVIQGNGTDHHIAITKDYYLVWYNPGAPSTSTTIDVTINFTAAGVYNYSNTLYHSTAVTSLESTTVTIPDDGLWYFYIYFDPMWSPVVSSMVSFDVCFTQPPPSLGRVYTIPIIILLPLLAVVIMRKTFRRKLTRNNKNNDFSESTTLQS